MSKDLVGILLRHGDTEANDQNLFRSRMDPPLNKKGTAQAEKAAKDIYKKHKDFVKKIVTSPMLRACQTADVLAEKLHVPVEQDRGLISWHLGFMTGKDRDEYQELLDYYINNPKSVPPEGESLDNLEERNREFFDKALRTEGTVYVTHNSNLVVLEGMINGDKEGRPESSETSVDPGGIIGIYVDDSGKYSTEVLFGVEKPAEFTS